MSIKFLFGFIFLALDEIVKFFIKRPRLKDQEFRYY